MKKTGGKIKQYIWIPPLKKRHATTSYMWRLHQSPVRAHFTKHWSRVDMTEITHKKQDYDQKQGSHDSREWWLKQATEANHGKDGCVAHQCWHKSSDHMSDGWDKWDREDVLITLGTKAGFMIVVVERSRRSKGSFIYHCCHTETVHTTLVSGGWNKL